MAYDRLVCYSTDFGLIDDIGEAVEDRFGTMQAPATRTTLGGARAGDFGLYIRHEHPQADAAERFALDLLERATTPKA